MRYMLGLFLLLGAVTAFKLIEQPPPSYNITASQQIVKLAAVAFCNKECVQSWTCGTGKSIPMTDTFYIEHSLTKAAGYVGYHTKNNQIILSFRGTSNIQNWIEDANFQKITYPRCKGCELHAGFYADYLLFEKILTQKVSVLIKNYPTASIITTGHSLGAAISAICAMQLKAIFPLKQVYIHNYGQPRVGNKEVALHMSEKLDGIYRVVHNKDIVPHAPPDLPGFAYHHPPYEVFFNSDLSSYKVCDSSGEDSSCSNKFFPAYDPNDHDHYFIYISQTKC